MNEPLPNPFDEIQRAVDRARIVNIAVDQQAEAMALLLTGRLRAASKSFRGAQAVAALKRELADFNAQTHRWKERP